MIKEDRTGSGASPEAKTPQIQTQKGSSMFNSSCKLVGKAEIPDFTGIRIMMMPLIIGRMETIPETLSGYRPTLESLFALSPKHMGEIGYLTIDEKIVASGETHRRAGAHVDGIFEGKCAGPWADTGGGGWGSAGNGMLTVSSHVGCRAWNRDFNGWPGFDGECDHLSEQFQKSTEVTFGAGEVYWVDGMCVHESLPMPEATPRAFVRLSLPSKAPWFDGYTINPLGIQPTGPILPRRKYL